MSVCQKGTQTYACVPLPHTIERPSPNCTSINPWNLSLLASFVEDRGRAGAAMLRRFARKRADPPNPAVPRANDPSILIVFTFNL
jgi:hypothetical protein